MIDMNTASIDSTVTLEPVTVRLRKDTHYEVPPRLEQFNLQLRVELELQ